MIRLNSTRFVEFVQSLTCLPQGVKDSRAIVIGIDALIGVESSGAVEVAQSVVIIPVEPVKIGCYAMHGCVVRGLAQQALNLGARLLFLAAREIDKDHVEACFNEPR